MMKSMVNAFNDESLTPHLKFPDNSDGFANLHRCNYIFWMTASCNCGIAAEVLARESLKLEGTAYEGQLYQGTLLQRDNPAASVTAAFPGLPRVTPEVG
jgi:hypothetical protein